MFRHSENRKRGFTLIELAIVLTVAGLMFVGLWRLLSGGNQQVRDQSVGSQHLQLISAVKSYLTSGEDSFLENLPVGTVGAQLVLPPAGTNTTVAICKANIAVANKGLCDFLPTGFDQATVNAYGQTYNAIYVERNDSSVAGANPASYSFMIVTLAGDTIPDSSGGRISTYIGGDGGFIYSNAVCGNPLNAALACGAYGTWTSAITAYNVPGGDAVGGHVASRSYISPTVDNLSPWLERTTLIAPDPAFTWNTMTTDLYMGGTSSQAAVTNGSIYLGPPVAGNAPPYYIAGNAPGNIYLAAPGVTTGGGTINLVGGRILELGDANNTGNITMTSNGPLHTGFGFVVLSTSCTRDPSLIGGGNNGYGLGPYDANCEPGMQVGGDENITGYMQAFDFFAQTFVYQGSDIRLKRDVEPLVNPLDDIMRLKPVSFTFKSNGKKGLGVIAQDIEKIYPELVTPGPGMKSVAYDGLIAPLIGAVQELKKENDQLRQELSDQKAQQKTLENELHQNQRQ